MWTGEGRRVPEAWRLGLSDIESFASALAGPVNNPTAVASTQGVPQELSSELRCSSEAGVGIQQCCFYPNQSAKILLNEFCELNTPTRLDPSQQTSLGFGQIVQFPPSVVLDVALAFFGMLEDLLMKYAKVNPAGAGSAGERRSPYLSQNGSTVVECLASKSHYILPTTGEDVLDSHEQFGGL